MVILNKKKKKKEEKENLLPRPPVVVVIGHVDHGKTTLLDKIRKTTLAEKEVGGITQKIGAYETEIEKKDKKAQGKQKITFLDTPGHEAFSEMRKRGIKVADIAVLVVASDDGVQPQTIEAIRFAKSAGIPIIAAFNKTDKPEANVALVKKQLSEHEVLTEDWGGQTMGVEISAKTGKGIPELLDSILLLAEMEELKADYGVAGEGVILESKMDSKKGALATFLVKNGTLKIRDFVVAGKNFGKIKRMENFKGETVNIAVSSTPVIVSGMETLPNPGEAFKSFKDIEKAKTALKANLEILATEEKIKAEPALAVEKVFGLILKADTQGSLEAIKAIFSRFKPEEVTLKIFKAEIGAINENDIKDASATKSIIVGFNSFLSAGLIEFAKQKKVRIISGEIIYKLIDEAKELIVSLLPLKINKIITGKLRVIAIFKIIKEKEGSFEAVFGAKVTEGKILAGAKIDILRKSEPVGQGKVVELQLNKAAVKEVSEPNNAGIRYKGSAKIEMGDALETYTEEIIKPKI